MNEKSSLVHNTEEVTFTHNDVLCGRGRAVWKHPGNIVFRSFIQQYIDAYANATCRAGKSDIIAGLMQQLKKNNIRMLKRDEAGKWQQLGDKEMKHKIGHALRDTRPDCKSPTVPIVSGKEMKSTTLITTAAHSTSAVAHARPLTMSEMLDEIQKSKRRLLSQKSPFQLPGRYHSVSVNAPTNAFGHSNAVETTQSTSATLSSTYNLGIKPTTPLFPTEIALPPRKIQNQQLKHAGLATMEGAISILQTDDTFDPAVRTPKDQQHQHPRKAR